MSEMTDARRVVVIDDYGLTALAVGGHTEYGSCTRAELWAAIEDLDEKAERYGLGLELDGPQDLERATTERKAARAVVRELLGMEAES